MGIKSKLHGDEFENILSTLHKRYEAEGLAFVRHNGLKAEKHFRRGKLRTIAKKSAPDFTGVTNTGRYVEFDAKYVGADRPYYYHAADKAHQLQQLWRVHQIGGLAFLLVYFHVLGEAYLIAPDTSWKTGVDSFSINLDKQPGVLAAPAATYFPHDYAPDWVAVLDDFHARTKNGGV